MSRINLVEFLDAIDLELIAHAEIGETLDLYLLGRSALILGFGAQEMTKDIDVVDDRESKLLKICVDLFGKNSKKSSEWQYYLEAVTAGLPPLPMGYQIRCVPIEGTWKVICPKRPDAHDLIISKLKRFHAGDRKDIRFLCRRGDIDTETLRERFDSAHCFSDRDDPGFVRSNEHLQLVIDHLEGDEKAI